jgi:hypothetical protein
MALGGSAITDSPAPNAPRVGFHCVHATLPSRLCGDVFSGSKAFCCKSDPLYHTWQGKWISAGTGAYVHCEFRPSSRCGKLICGTSTGPRGWILGEGMIKGPDCNMLDEILPLVPQTGGNATEWQGSASYGIIQWVRRVDGLRLETDVWYRAE